MNTQNVKTAATKTTETWVKQNFDVHLSMRTNRRVSLAKLEGDLMKHRAMQKLGVDTEELFDDLQLAVACITTMIDRGVRCCVLFISRVLFRFLNSSPCRNLAHGRLRTRDAS